MVGDLVDRGPDAAGDSSSVVPKPEAEEHRDRRLQFFRERCLSLKQEFNTYLETKRCA
jgi:hypothetical protein